jgi:pimeloyl-ACP methyl ester carboxylesterase
MADQPGLVTVGPHRLSVTVSGQGAPAVVIEPAFGGSARSWHAVAAVLAAETTVVTYDRAAYGESSRICVRAFAARYDSEVAGMVLVDSSHEAQDEALRGSLPWYLRLAEKAVLPALLMGTRGFRSGADRRSVLREYRSSGALTAADQLLAPGALGRRPLAVVTRGPGRGTSVPEGWRRWHQLHTDLAGLSANSRHIVAGDPGHYVHKRDPGLVTGTILDVLRSARDAGPLENRAPDGP